MQSNGDNVKCDMVILLNVTKVEVHYYIKMWLLNL